MSGVQQDLHWLARRLGSDTSRQTVCLDVSAAPNLMEVTDLLAEYATFVGVSAEVETTAEGHPAALTLSGAANRVACVVSVAGFSLGP